MGLAGTSLVESAHMSVSGNEGQRPIMAEAAPATAETLSRHTLVWPRESARWQTLTPGAEPRLHAWFAAGHPAIVARDDAGEPVGTLRLGVPLPPTEGRHRLALRMCRADLARSAPPPALCDIASACSSSALRELARDAGALAPRVFGSYAWQAQTGLDYVGPASDLDLLWRVEAATQADEIVALLHRWEARHGLRADGEFTLCDGKAVNWREYASVARQLLVKSQRGCGLLPREALFAPPCSDAPMKSAP